MENNKNEEGVADNQANKAENAAQNKVSNTDENITTPKKKLGVTSETQASSGLPIPAPYKSERTPQFPNKYTFPIAKLVKVYFDNAKELKNGDVSPVLGFVFVAQGTPKKQFTHLEFPIDDTDAKFEQKEAWLSARLKHFFVETIGENRFVEGSMSGDTFSELFENVANAFNSVTYKEIPFGGSEDDAKILPVFTKNPVYIKLVYNKSRLQFGLFPNLIQRAMKGDITVPCELTINPQYDNIDPQIAPSINPGGGISSNAGFGVGVNDDDYPDI